MPIKKVRIVHKGYTESRVQFEIDGSLVTITDDSRSMIIIHISDLRDIVAIANGVEVTTNVSDTAILPCA